MKFIKSKKEITPELEDAYIKDTILTILYALGSQPIEMINLELRRCGFMIGFADTKKYLKSIADDGYIEFSGDKINLN